MRPTPLLFVALGVAACNAVLGLEELPRASDGATAGLGGAGGKGASGGKGGAGSSGRGGSGAAGEGGEMASGGELGTGGEGGGEPGMVCVPNEETCDGNRATVCNSLGTGFVEDGTDCSLTQTCLDGACTDHQCTPNERFCAGDAVRECASDGLSSSEVEECTAQQYCDAEQADCLTGVCAPNLPACDDNRATTCDETGSGYLAGGTVCDGNTTCEAGVCRPQLCTPSETFCQGSEVKLCSDDGLSSTVDTTCGQTQYCEDSSASCQDQVCSPGVKDCSGSTARQCNGDGSGFASSEPCSTSQYCDPGSGTCKNAIAGSIWALWPMPNPPSLGLVNPASYDVSVADVVIDRVTGLMWQRAVPGSSYTQPNAVTYCNNLSLAGYTDWKVPTRIELASLLDHTVGSPSIDTAALPTPIASFWSSSTRAGATGWGWYVDFQTSGVHYASTSTAYRVRCVR